MGLFCLKFRCDCLISSSDGGGTVQLETKKSPPLTFTITRKIKMLTLYVSTYYTLDCLRQRQVLQFPGRCCFPLSNRGTAFFSSKERNGPALIAAFKCFLYLPGDGLREIFFAVVRLGISSRIPRGRFAVFFVLVIGILVCSQSGDPPLEDLSKSGYKPEMKYKS